MNITFHKTTTAVHFNTVLLCTKSLPRIIRLYIDDRKPILLSFHLRPATNPYPTKSNPIQHPRSDFFQSILQSVATPSQSIHTPTSTPTNSAYCPFHPAICRVITVRGKQVYRRLTVQPLPRSDVGFLTFLL